jgi:GntR family transcriptional regulator
MVLRALWRFFRDTGNAMATQPPQYQFIAEMLLKQIADGTYVLGGRLPTEAQLAAEHGLARETIRRALGRLEQLGMIERRPGAGTTVVSTAPVGSYPTFATSSEDIASFAAETKLRRPTSGEINVDAATARRIGTRSGTGWFAIRGLRVQRANTDLLVCWSEHYLRADLPREKFSRGPIALEDVTAASVEQTVTAELMAPDMAEALAVEPYSAALVVTRRHRDRRGRVVGAGIHTHPADRYKIVTTVPFPAA